MTDTIIAEDIELRSPDALIPYTNNPKEHPDEQVDKIASSIKNYGWDQPIVVDAEGEIIKGHGRLQAAKRLGLNEVPVIERDDLTDAEKRASRIADNKTAESDWKDSDLALELEQLDEQDFDLGLTGFDDNELDDLLNDLDESEPNSLDSEPLAEKDVEDIKILNLYAGVGGNRTLWGDADVTAVEYNDTIAQAYEDHYPDDTVVVADAHEYLLDHFQEFDFIWSSPPCPTHSKMRKNIRYNAGENPENNLSEIDPVYPDMTLYQHVLLLEHYFEGLYCVENVISYYDPLIEPTEFDRHYFWTNFDLDPKSVDKGENLHDNDPERVEDWLGIDLSPYDFPDDYNRQKVVNNTVHPELGKHILDAAIESDT